MRALALSVVLAAGCRLNAAGLDDSESLLDANIADATNDGLTDGACACPPGLRCVGGGCCDPVRACGTTCCPESSICLFGNCTAVGNPCRKHAECPSSEQCEIITPAAPTMCSQPAGRCVARASACTATPPAADERATPCTVGCKLPPTGSTEPLLKYAWGGRLVAPFEDDVIASPVVAPLADDNCDGTIDARDRPDVIFVTTKNGSDRAGGVLHAARVVDGKLVERWKAGSDLLPRANPAVGNVDGLAGNEVVACTQDNGVRAFDAAGKALWASPATGFCQRVLLADLGGDGSVEVITDSAIYEGATGKRIAVLTAGPFSQVTTADLDGDGKLEIVSANYIWNEKGERIANVNAGDVAGGPLPFGHFAAIADFDVDGKPEIVAIDWLGRKANVWRYERTATPPAVVVRRGIDLTGGIPALPQCAGTYGATAGGSAPLIADFDGDGRPDLGVATGAAYAVFRGARLLDSTLGEPLLWAKPIWACGYAQAGSIAFDFDHDGRVDIAVIDDKALHLFRGSDGASLFRACNSGLQILQQPVVADIDGDGSGELIAAANAYHHKCDAGDKTSGIRVFGASWPRARRIWHQEDYRATNVLDDGSIPRSETPSWKAANDVRNASIASPSSAPDLVVSLTQVCTPTLAVAARVRNMGDALFDGVARVTFRAGSNDLGTRELKRALFPGESAWTIFPLTVPPSEPLVAEVASGTRECRTSNNSSAPLAWDGCR